MAVRIRLFSTLVGLSKTQQPRFEVDWRAGMTVADIVAAEGFSAQDAEAIAAVRTEASSAQPTPAMKSGIRSVGTMK